MLNMTDLQSTLRSKRRGAWNDHMLLRLVTVVLLLHGTHLEGTKLKCLAQEDNSINRKNFPPGFVFGTSSSAIQYEGAVNKDGRGPSIWDKFSHTFGKILDLSNADVAVDHYHRYKEDIDLIKDMGMDAHRFSISWSRIFPNGSGQVNQDGIDHYNNVINALLAKGIKPYVTIYHWDLPQALQDRYNGWLSTHIINDYAVFAETLFKNYGDRVKNWITLNEPHNVAIQGYDLGVAAPGRCSVILGLSCAAGNSATEPYRVAHNMLLSHAKAVEIYREKYQRKQNGTIGATFDAMWYEPATNSQQDIEAAQRARDFELGWFLDPLMFGDYQSSMKERVRDRLPRFTRAESILLKGSLDFVGINHFTSRNAGNDEVMYVNKALIKDAQSDSGVTITPPLGQDGNLILDTANSFWLYIVPGGIRHLMKYIKDKYGNPPVVITENGMDDANNPLIPTELALKDEKRIKYHNDYLRNLLASIKEDGCNVKGYFVWSLLDNWEWAEGYTSRFGLYFVDYNNNLTRYAKTSVHWFKLFLNPTSSSYP